MNDEWWMILHPWSINSIFHSLRAGRDIVALCVWERNEWLWNGTPSSVIPLVVFFFLRWLSGLKMNLVCNIWSEASCVVSSIRWWVSRTTNPAVGEGHRALSFCQHFTNCDQLTNWNNKGHSNWRCEPMHSTRIRLTQNHTKKIWWYEMIWGQWQTLHNFMLRNDAIILFKQFAVPKTLQCTES